MNAQLKFGILTVVIVAALGWLAMGGISESATYYVTIEELQGMAEEAKARRLRVGGDVVPGSIVRDAGRVAFVIEQSEEETSGEPRRLEVVYVGSDPLPDTFRDRAQALCEGRLTEGNIFEAHKIQAKCTSKYEADPSGGARPVYDTPAKPADAT